MLSRPLTGVWFKWRPWPQAARYPRDRSLPGCCRRPRCLASFRNWSGRVPRRRRPSISPCAIASAPSGWSPPVRLLRNVSKKPAGSKRRRSRVNAPPTRRSAQYNSARTGTGTGTANGLFILRSPISGAIVSRQATTGANVSAGTTLFAVADVAQVHVTGRIPEAHATHATRTTAAEIEASGREPVPIQGRPAMVGKVLDPETRTLAIVFAFDNRALRLPLGHAVFLRLLMEETAPTTVIPASAVVDDAGRPIVFVQTGGESFERRPVTIGMRQADNVQVTEGLKAGERVVSKGAHLVRLASLSTQVPAHGHVH